MVQPLPPQPAYASSARNAIRSRAWGTAVEGFSYRVCTDDGQRLCGCKAGLQLGGRVVVILMTSTVEASLVIDEAACAALPVLHE